jgi:hypothetical protein
MTLIFIDTEFTGFFREVDRRLISFGAVSLDGRHFYAEFTDTWRPEDSHPWVSDNVIPLLEGGDARLSLAQASVRLADWIRSVDESVLLVSDAINYDWPFVRQLLASDWPANLAVQAVSLPIHLLREGDRFEPALEAAYGSGLRRHHALDDARANRLAYLDAGGFTDFL